MEPNKLKVKDKISKNEDPTEEESEMVNICFFLFLITITNNNIKTTNHLFQGMILIICGCAVVALVIIAVIAGTIVSQLSQ